MGILIGVQSVNATMKEIKTDCGLFDCYTLLETSFNIPGAYIGNSYDISEIPDTYKKVHIGKVAGLEIHVIDKNHVNVTGMIPGATQNLWGIVFMGDKSHENSTWWNSSYDMCFNITFNNGDSIPHDPEILYKSFSNMTPGFSNPNEVRVIDEPCRNGGNEKYAQIKSYYANGTNANITMWIYRDSGSLLAGANEVWSIYWNSSDKSNTSYHTTFVYAWEDFDDKTDVDVTLGWTDLAGAAWSEIGSNGAEITDLWDVTGGTGKCIYSDLTGDNCFKLDTTNIPNNHVYLSRFTRLNNSDTNYQDGSYPYNTIGNVGQYDAFGHSPADNITYYNYTTASQLAPKKSNLPYTWYNKFIDYNLITKYANGNLSYGLATFTNARPWQWGAGSTWDYIKLVRNGNTPPALQLACVDRVVISTFMFKDYAHRTTITAGTFEYQTTTTTTTTIPSNNSVVVVTLPPGKMDDINAMFGGAFILFAGLMLLFIPAMGVFSILKNKR